MTAALRMARFEHGASPLPEAQFVAEALPPMEVSSRIGRLRAALDQTSTGDAPDGLVVANRVNVAYLTGFTGSAGTLYLFSSSAVLVTDGRYAEQAEQQIRDAGADVKIEIVAAEHHGEVAKALVQSTGARRLSFEAAHLSWAAASSMREWFPGVELVASTGLVEQLRIVKDDGELARLARAAAIADQAFAGVVTGIEDEPTERELGLWLDTEMRRLGASGPSFETIVASGPNAAKPHHRPSQRTIGIGEAVVIDFGALVEGYCSDMTRTVWRDELRDPQIKRAVQVVYASQAAGLEAVSAGVSCSAVDGVCRAVIDDAGLAEHFVHGTGHGVGLDIHEAPAVSARSTDTLASGHVVTVEPGIYLPGVGGVRIEDTVVVTATGCIPLTKTEKRIC